MGGGEVEIQPSVDAGYSLGASLPLHVDFFKLCLYMGYSGLLWSLVADIQEQASAPPAPPHTHKKKASQA